MYVGYLRTETVTKSKVIQNAEMSGIRSSDLSTIESLHGENEIEYPYVNRY
jgi:hypothetical protein